MTHSILFVDDDRNLLDSITRLLRFERSDYTFDTATSGDEALKYLESNKYDVIVSDQKMPGMMGLTLLSIVRTKYPDMKRVMLSAQVLENVFHEAESVANVYISKPCDFEFIISQIDKLLTIQD